MISPSRSLSRYYYRHRFIASIGPSFLEHPPPTLCRLVPQTNCMKMKTLHGDCRGAIKCFGPNCAEKLQQGKTMTEKDGENTKYKKRKKQQ